MNPYRVLYVAVALMRSIWSVRFLTALLSVFGALFLIVDITERYVSPELSRDIEDQGWAFFGLAIVFAAWICWPRTSFGCNLKGRDVAIEVRIGDLFHQEGDLIIGTNTTFETRLGNHISPKSIQGQYTNKYYSGNAGLLDTLMSAQLEGLEYETLSDGREGKLKRYRMGTTIRLQMNDSTAFLVAMAHMNAHGACKSSLDDLLQSLTELWYFISERGTKGTLVAPVLGSNYGRLAPTREEIVQEMIKSFVAACSQETFCKKLVIVIHDADVIEHKVDLKKIEAFLHHTCLYTQWASPSDQKIGSRVA